MSEKDLISPVQNTNGVMENNIDGMHVSKRYFSSYNYIIFIIILSKVATNFSNLKCKDDFNVIDELCIS